MIPLNMCRRHTVTVLERTETQGAQMGRVRTWAPASPTPRVLDCTAVQGQPRDQRLLGQDGVVIPYTLYFGSDPVLNETQRLKLGNVVLRLQGLTANQNGCDLLWVQLAEARTDDNPSADVDGFDPTP